MTADSSVELQQLIDQFPHGGTEVRRELLERATDRLRRLTAKILGQSFPALNLVHDVDSVVNETWMRLLPALEKTEPETVQDFFRLAAHKIRQVLLDMVERGKSLNQERSMNSNDSANGFDPSQSTFDPSQLIMWSEFHQRVETLEEEERKVFEMHYYLEVPKSQIAQVLNIPRSRVSQLWIQATERLIVDSSLLDQVH
jgi:RNA polymerase sigma factor (sigma-70 family)